MIRKGVNKPPKTIGILAGLLMLVPVAVLVAADVYQLTLSTWTYWSLGALFVVASGVNVSQWAKDAGALAAAINSVQKALKLGEVQEQEREANHDR